MGTDIKLNKRLADESWKNYKEIVYEPFVEVIKEIIVKNNYKTVLDFGCGMGKTAYYLRKIFKLDILIDGVDISKEAKIKGRKYYDNFYLKYNYKAPDNKYDFVILASVIEHIYDENLKILLKDLKTKLNRNGSLFIVVPNTHSPIFVLFDSKERQKREMGHINLKAKREWVDFLKTFGFTNFEFSFPIKFKYLKNINFFRYRLLNIFLQGTYKILAIYPFYYLRNSLWIRVS